MDVPPSVEDGPQSIARHARGIVGNIIESAAVWYALLYLVQIEGREDLRFEFDRVTENLSQAFVWYIVFATHKEMTNAGQRYFIEGDPVQTVSAERYENHIKRERGIRGLPHVYATGGPDSLIGAVILHVEDVTGWLDSNGLLSDPEQACADVARLFEGMAREPPGNELDLRATDYSGWYTEFNGDAWAAIARHGADRDSPTRVTWVDQTFSVEHNNGNFLDKVKPSGDRRERLGNEVYHTNHLSIHEYQTDFLQELLDQNHAGNMSYVFGVAVGVDETFDLGFGFRQAYRRAGSLNDPLTEGKDLQPVFSSAFDAFAGP